MYVICDREHLRALETPGGRLLLQARLDGAWAPLGDESAIDDLLEELRDVLAELTARAEELRAEPPSMESDSRAVQRAYRAFAGYGTAFGRSA